MPELIDAFRHLDGMDLPELHARYEELIASMAKLPNGQPDPAMVHDDTKLQEICAILANLRKRSAGPPKKRPSESSGRPRRAAQPVPETSLDDL